MIIVRGLCWPSTTALDLVGLLMYLLVLITKVTKTKKQGSRRPTTPSFCEVKCLFSLKSAGGFEESIKGHDRSSSPSVHQQTLNPSHLVILCPLSRDVDLCPAWWQRWTINRSAIVMSCNVMLVSHVVTGGCLHFWGVVMTETTVHRIYEEKNPSCA